MRESGAVPESAYTARMLYAAVSSDTGSFRYANTDARAHLCAAYLVGIINSDKDGEDTAQIARLLFDSKPYLSFARRLWHQRICTFSAAPRSHLPL